MNNAKKIFEKGLKFYKNGNLDAAIKALSSITCADDKETYAKSRFSLGLLYKEINNKEKAIETWSSINREDDVKITNNCQTIQIIVAL